MNVTFLVHARVHMPVPVDPYSELFCSVPIISIAVPLTYNLTLLFLCAVFGFLTRKLPENYNEAWYIFVSVTTTAFLWMVFLPTYFTTFYAVFQAALLATCLLINAAINLLCLFLPKIYALYFIDEANLKFATINTISTYPTTTVSQ